MHTRLVIPHPRAFLDAIPAKVWDAPRGAFVFAPSSVEDAADRWERHVFGLLVARSLQILNLDWGQDDWEEARASLLVGVGSQARASARRAGFQFVSASPNPRRTMEGAPSAGWLDRAVEKAVERAIEQWDPTVAEARRRSARVGGSRSKRPAKFKPSDLPAGSITWKMEVLGVSRSTILRLRRRQGQQ